MFFFNSLGFQDHYMNLYWGFLMLLRNIKDLFYDYLRLLQVFKLIFRSLEIFASSKIYFDFEEILVAFWNS